MNDQKEIPASENTATRITRSALEWLEFFCFAFISVLLIVTLVVRHSPVVGTSMFDTLDNKDVLIISDLCYTPERGDIIVVQSQTYGFDRPLVKRVIARGGDVLDIDFETWTVTVNGEVVEEPYVTRVAGSMHSLSNRSYPLTVPEGKLFVMGDNRNGSSDSRSASIGFVDERHVMGHVLFRLYPFDKIGLLEQ